MDSTLTSKNKQQKTEELDDLPEEVIGEILSVLPIKDAVRTSVLAKPWKDRWKYISNIKLKEDEYHSRQHFKDVMDKLHSISSTLSLQKFSLTFNVEQDSAKVNQWLIGFIKPMIQELEVQLQNATEQLMLPEHLFNSKSLKHLDLAMSLSHPLNLPPYIHFAALRILTLKNVKFTGTTQTRNFFSGCPSLQELSLIDCQWDNVDSIRIDSPSLHSLTIEEWGFYSDSPSEGVHPCHIVINGNNNLKTFSYNGRLVNDYTLFSTSSVNDAILNICPQLHNNILNRGQLVSNFLVAFPNVENLYITSFGLIALSYSPALLRMIPMFDKLVVLNVGSVWAPVYFPCDAMQTILRNAPNLEDLLFLKSVVLCEYSVSRIDPIPSCLETHIKFIGIDNFRGTEEEKFAIKFLLKWAKVVTSFNVFVDPHYIKPSDEGSDDKLDELMDEFRQYPKAETCAFYLE